MARFSYRAFHPERTQVVRAFTDGESIAEVAAQLRRGGLVPLAIAPAPEDAGVMRTGAAPRRRGRAARGFSKRSAKRRKLTPFTRQLATLVSAGVPLARALEILARTERDPAFGEVLRGVGEVIASGGQFADGLARHPRIFTTLHVNMVRAGEASGALGPVLARLAHFLEKSDKLRARLVSAMIYPAVIMAVAGGILSVLMIFVVPKFEQIFAGLLKGQPLPAPTRVLLAASHALGAHLPVALGVGAAVFGGVAWLRRTSRGKLGCERLLLASPIFGPLVLKAGVARFTRTLGSLVVSGVPLLDALTITRSTAGNLHLSRVLERVQDRVRQGQGVAVALEAEPLIPELVAGMVQVGEETGKLAEMLGRVADAYEEEVDVAVAGLTAVIEPVMIVVMAVVVGGIVVALFLPIIGIIQHLQ